VSAVEACAPAEAEKAQKTKRKVWTRDELDLAGVNVATSTNETRQHLCKPFGCFMNGRGFLVGTDGNRMHVVASDQWVNHKRDDAPRAEAVIPWESAVRLGEFLSTALDDARPLCWSSRWASQLQTSPNDQRVFYHVPAASKNKPAVYPFGRDGVKVDYFKLDALKWTVGLQLCYLLEAVDFVGPGLLTLWQPVAKQRKFDGLDPVVITRGTAPIREQDRFAVVMPFRT
jgi:hypothetical protein